MIDVMATRFDGLSDEGRIRESVTVRPPPVTGLSSMNAPVAAKKLGYALEEIYLPTPFAIGFMKEMVGRAILYCQMKFDSEKSYVSSVYCPSNVETKPICLAGPAGVGKSATMRALIRLLPSQIDLKVDHFDGVHKLVSHWYASAKEKKSGREILIDFLGADAEKGRPNQTKLKVECKRRANRDGVSLLVLDETQHISTGVATARVTEILLTMAEIGPPLVYVSNYSLVHKLLRRNIEEKQRLLVEPRVMLPDAPESEAWRDYIRECIRVSNGIFCIEEDDLAAELYRSTFGIKRLAVQLIEAAYVAARADGRQTIGITDIYRAYRSTEYTVNRTDVELLQRQAIENRPIPGRLDLWCPFELPKESTSTVVHFHKADRAQRVANKVFLSSLNEAERSAVAFINRAAPEANDGSTAPKKRVVVPKATKESLVDAFNELLDPTRSGPNRPK